MNNSNLPHPLHHRSKEQLLQFVSSSSWADPHKNTVFPHHNSQFRSNNNVHNNCDSLFDHYFRNNLLKSACNPSDVQQVTRNPVVYQEKMQPITQRKSPKKQMASKTLGYIPDSDNISMEAKANEFLFNYRQTAKQKKEKKMQFLENIQKKLDHLQKETQNLGNFKENEERQIKTMLNIYSNDIKEQANQNSIVGKLNTLIYETMPDMEFKKQPQPITSEMQHLEINAAIQDQHEYNNYLINLADRVSKSKQKNRQLTSLSRQKIKSHQKSGGQSHKKGNNFNKTGMSQNSLGKTLKKSINGVPPRPISSKKMISTWKQIPKTRK